MNEWYFASHVAAVGLGLAVGWVMRGDQIEITVLDRLDAISIDWTTYHLAERVRRDSWLNLPGGIDVIALYLKCAFASIRERLCNGETVLIEDIGQLRYEGASVFPRVIQSTTIDTNEEPT